MAAHLAHTRYNFIDNINQISIYQVRKLRMITISRRLDTGFQVSVDGYKTVSMYHPLEQPLHLQTTY